MSSEPGPGPGAPMEAGERSWRLPSLHHRCPQERKRPATSVSWSVNKILSAGTNRAQLVDLLGIVENKDCRDKCSFIQIR